MSTGYLSQQQEKTTRAPSPKPITGATANSKGEIRITCVAHGFATGSHVAIEGVTGTVEANHPYWNITVVDGDHFDLRGSTFENAYTGGGTATLV